MLKYSGHYQNTQESIINQNQESCIISEFLNALKFTYTVLIISLIITVLIYNVLYYCINYYCIIYCINNTESRILYYYRISKCV